MEDLKKHASYAGAEGPVVLVIMDGVGIGKNPVEKINEVGKF